MSRTLDNQVASPQHQAQHQAQTLNTIEAAAYIGIGKRTLQELMASGEIPYVKIGKIVRFRPEDLTAFIDKKLVKAVGWKGGAKR